MSGRSSLQPAVQNSAVHSAVTLAAVVASGRQIVQQQRHGNCWVTWTPIGKQHSCAPRSHVHDDDMLLCSPGICVVSAQNIMWILTLLLLRWPSNCSHSRASICLC